MIGRHLDRAALTARLDACLLTAAEFAGGPAAWASFDDPFGPWIQESEDDAACPLPPQERAADA